MWRCLQTNSMFCKPQKNYLQPAMNTVELVEWAIRNSSRPGSKVFDQFWGSGTMLIVAEKSRRCCFMVKLDPKYVNVIVRRWQDWTGHHAPLEYDGAGFGDVVSKKAGSPDN